MALLWLPRQIHLTYSKFFQSYCTEQPQSLWSFLNRSQLMVTAECTQKVPPFVKTFAKPQKTGEHVGLLRVEVWKTLVKLLLLFHLSWENGLMLVVWCGGGISSGTSWRQACMKDDCSAVGDNWDISCASCLHPSWSAQAVCMCLGLTFQTAKANVNNLQIPPFNPSAAETIKTVEVHFGTKVLQSYKCL